ncbi:MAG: hypothetical protein LBN30_02560 [Oscillospiraceae bacterium]|nr:hypothetical protein [Oscillospiraceae bacterium]
MAKKAKARPPKPVVKLPSVVSDTEMTGALPVGVTGDCSLATLDSSGFPIPLKSQQR